MEKYSLLIELYTWLFTLLQETYATTLGFWIAHCILFICAGFLFSRAFKQLNKARTSENIPTSKVSSAPKGYIELKGQAKPFANELLISPRSSMQCIWYRETTEISDNHVLWYPIHKQSSDNIFVLEDKTGKCYVNPSNANFTVNHKSTWYDDEGHTRYTEEFIMEGEPLYVVGEHHAVQASEPRNFKQKVKNLITKWHQRYPKKLLADYDENKNGKLESKELRKMHKDAETAVKIADRESSNGEDLGIIKQPELSSKPFLISTYPEDHLVKKHKNKAFVSLFGFFLIGSAMVWLINLRLA